LINVCKSPKSKMKISRAWKAIQQIELTLWIILWKETEIQRKRNRNIRCMENENKDTCCLLRTKVIQYNSINTTYCWNQITKPSIQVWTQWIHLPKYLIAVYIFMVWSNVLRTGPDRPVRPVRTWTGHSTYMELWQK
jgi:hypothetical protein